MKTFGASNLLVLLLMVLDAITAEDRTMLHNALIADIDSEDLTTDEVAPMPILFAIAGGNSSPSAFIVL